MAGKDQTATNRPDPEKVKFKIIRAASKLFEEKGLYQTSVGEIAEEAGVSVPVAYSYVNRKSEIMLLIMDDFTQRVIDTIKPEVEKYSDPKIKLIRAIELFYDFLMENQSQTFLLYRDSNALDAAGRAKIMTAEQKQVDIFKKILDDGVRMEVFKPHFTEMVAYNILLLGHGYILKRWHYAKKLTPREYCQEQTEFILKAVGARPEPAQA